MDQVIRQNVALGRLDETPPAPSQQDVLEMLERERLLREVTVAQRDRLARRLQSLQLELAETRHQLEEAAAAGANARRELDLLWGSNSWRYTRPLREVGLVVRALLRRARTVFGSETKAAGADTARDNANAMMSSDAARVFDELRQAVANVRRE
jgi:hypothetical protein